MVAVELTRWRRLEPTVGLRHWQQMFAQMVAKNQMVARL